MLYSYNGQYPSQLPNRIRLSSGLTRTDNTTFTTSELIDAGYIAVPNAPDVDADLQHVTWNGAEWVVVDYTAEEVLARRWDRVREIRNGTIAQLDWRINRHLSEVRLGLTPTESLSDLDEYIQLLRDVTKQPDPTNITWPTLMAEVPTNSGSV